VRFGKRLLGGLGVKRIARHQLPAGRLERAAPVLADGGSCLKTLTEDEVLSRAESVFDEVPRR
jgi:hypothetical protein